MRLIFVLIFLITCITGIPALYAQDTPTDTLRLTLKEAEDQFLKNNLSLIIQHYNIDNAQAQIITARLFQNPQLNYNIGAYNPVTKKLFSLNSSEEDITRNGEYSAGISQLFLTAGKRNKNIALAKVGVQQATYQFFDLLRTLKFTLRNDFFSIYFQQQSEKVYNQEITSLQKILAAFKDQYAKGYIAEKEVLRIQSQLYSLQAEYNSLLMNINTTAAEFKMLIKAPARSKFTAVYNYELDGKAILTAVPYQTLLDSAYQYRTDLKIAKANMAFNDVNLKVQRALAWPDVTLSANFDKYGSYIRNYNSLGIAFPLPFFNRNQGAIKQARVAIDQGKEQYQQQQDHVGNDIAVSYENALNFEQFCNSLDPKFKKNYTHLIQEVLKNYTIRNISLLDFLNYYEDYRSNTLLLNNALLNRVIALEQLNYVTGTQLFNK
jgi:cobalt-zinc-cadmium efflux system outer membrane protein